MAKFWGIVMGVFECEVEMLCTKCNCQLLPINKQSEKVLNLYCTECNLHFTHYNCKTDTRAALLIRTELGGCSVGKYHLNRAMIKELIRPYHHILCDLDLEHLMENQTEVSRALGLLSTCMTEVFGRRVTKTEGVGFVTYLITEIFHPTTKTNMTLIKRGLEIPSIREILKLEKLADPDLR